MASQQHEILRLVASGALRVGEAGELLSTLPPWGDVELQVRDLTGQREILQALVPSAFVTAAAAAGLRVALRVGGEPLSVTWQELADGLAANGRAEARDAKAGLVVLLVRASAPGVP